MRTRLTLGKDGELVVRKRFRTLDGVHDATETVTVDMTNPATTAENIEKALKNIRVKGFEILDAQVKAGLSNDG